MLFVDETNKTIAAVNRVNLNDRYFSAQLTKVYSLHYNIFQTKFLSVDASAAYYQSVGDTLLSGLL